MRKIFLCILFLSLALSSVAKGNYDEEDSRAKALLGAHQLIRKAKSSVLGKDYSIASKLYSEAIAIMEEYGDITTIIQETKLLYANILLQQGLLFESISIYSDIIVTPCLEEKTIVDRAVLPLTNIFLDIGQYEEVERIIRDFLKDKSVFDYPSLCSNFALALAFQGRCEEALELLINIANISEGYFKGIYLQNIGFVLMERSQYEEAANYLLDSLKYLVGAENLICRANYALTLAYIGKYAMAKKEIDKVLSKLKSIGGQEYTRALRKKAEILYLSGDVKSATAIFKKFYLCEKDWLLSNLPSFSLQQRLNLWAREKNLLSECFVLGEYAPEFLMEVALFRRQTSLLGEVYKNIGKYTLSDLQKSLSVKDATVEFIQYSDLHGKDMYGAVIMTKSCPATFVRLFEAMDLFQPNTVGDCSIYEAIRNEGKSSLNTLYTDSVLGDKIWAPIMEKLPSTIDNLYFAPDGIFHLWGIENMPFSRKDPIRLHRQTSLFNILNECDSTLKFTDDSSLVIGGLDYDELSEEIFVDSSPNHEAFHFLNAKFGSYKHPFTYLEGTKEEADSVAKFMLNPTLRYEIGEFELKESFGGYRNVHVATHGYSLNFGLKKRPEIMGDSIPYDVSLLGCGVALSGANFVLPNNIEDNLLSAREICDLDLSNVDFVVLSACQTAKGDIYDEGAAGLIRGLKNAGVTTILATLWKVDDIATMRFMQEFYYQLSRGESKYVAYKRAQDALRKNNYAHPLDDPYYWAPFILVDDK